jgi:hypothetical protein
VQDKVAPAAYIAPFWPWGQIGLIGASMIIFVVSIGSSFVHNEIIKGVMSITGPIIVSIMYAVHKVMYKDRFVTISQIEERLLGVEKSVEEGIITA